MNIEKRENGGIILKKTKRLLLILCVGGITIGIPFFFYDSFYGNPIRSLLMENATKKHLIQLGYHSDDLQEIKAFYSMKKDNGLKRTRALVIFKDEPEQSYIYVQRDKNGEVQQSCSYLVSETESESHYTDKRRHMVKDCVRTLFSFKE